MGVSMLLFLVCFLGWAVWVYLPVNRARLEAAARLPLDDGDAS
jgi:cbb3-type cytochrome oxidase subunit 3